MNDYTPSKVCTKCITNKPLTQFYKHENTKDGHHSWCKSCMKQHNTTKYKIGDVGEGSTKLVMDELARQGIPSVSGISCRMPYVDLMAWACVPVEAKTSLPMTGKNEMLGYYNWHFNQRQRTDWFDGLIVLVARNTEKGDRFFIIPSKHPYIWERVRDRNKESVVISIGRGGYRRNASTKLRNAILSFENAWHLVEEYRLMASAALEADAQPEKSEVI